MEYWLNVCRRDRRFAFPRSFPLRDLPLTIGRSPENHIVLSDEAVPEKAGRIEACGGAWLWRTAPGRGRILNRGDSCSVGPFRLSVRSRGDRWINILPAFAVFVLLAGGVGLNWKRFQKPVMAPPPIELPARGPFPISARTPLRFQFDTPLSPLVELHATFGNVLAPETALLRVGSVLLGSARVSPGSWAGEQRWVVPTELLREGPRVLEIGFAGMNPLPSGAVKDLYVTTVRDPVTSPEQLLSAARLLLAHTKVYPMAERRAKLLVERAASTVQILGKETREVETLKRDLPSVAALPTPKRSSSSSDCRRAVAVGRCLDVVRECQRSFGDSFSNRVLRAISKETRRRYLEGYTLEALQPSVAIRRFEEAARCAVDQDPFAAKARLKLQRIRRLQGD